MDNYNIEIKDWRKFLVARAIKTEAMLSVLLSRQALVESDGSVQDHDKKLMEIENQVRIQSEALSKKFRDD